MNKEEIELLFKMAERTNRPCVEMSRQRLYMLKEYIEDVEQENEWLKEIEKEHQKLRDKIDKAIDVINTQMKNADEGTTENLRIIKFNLIKSSCTFEDLKTEEDYKY